MEKYKRRSYGGEQLGRQGHDFLSKTISVWYFLKFFFFWNEPIDTLKVFFDLIYTAQNKYVCTRLFALFDVLNCSLNKKVYIILKLVQFPIQL